MIARIFLWVIAGGVTLGVYRYFNSFFISGTSFSANVTPTSGNITTIIGTEVPFTGSLYANNFFYYIIPFIIVIATLVAVFITIKRKQRPQR